MSLRIAKAFALLFLDKTYTDWRHHERARRIAIETGDTEHELKVLWMEYGLAVNQGRYDQALNWPNYIPRSQANRPNKWRS